MLEDRLMPHHRAAARLLTLLPLVALLAGCGSTGESRTVQIAERPRWTAGESWTYRGKGRDAGVLVQLRGEGLGEGAGYRYHRGHLRGRADRLLRPLTRGQRFWYSGRQRSRRASTCLIPSAITMPITPSTRSATIMSAAFRVPRDWMIR